MKREFIRKRLYEIIFESDTRAGKIFDVVLLCVILLSVILVMLESVVEYKQGYTGLFNVLEWLITCVFSFEYLVRIWVVNRPARYLMSFYGLIDLFSLLPSFLGLFWIGSHSLLVIRALRLLRVFRILKLNRYTKAGQMLTHAMWQSREKISVFLIFVVTLAIIIGTAMYLIEGEVNGFTSIPKSIYWAIVTLTTVGYGDLSPQTAMGQFLSSVVMIMGYAIIAVPTGIVTSAIITERNTRNTQVCPHCLFDRHDDDALYCKRCGGLLNEFE
ncbi:voltage-gated potassium channel [Breznakibacter xylanolyticus]|uniref:Voltage-gated potassium channel n=1 Tax=Breznakibacter xylanolyticus TaxID=990 RepID=A0A2W7NK42_9BACT|nr:ion transporter [Breznakibacter xylanolyticus]MBN2744432.1 ion transporter [Marinilabiliaceae bacterium]PZX13556.1 voltage-gated potassium channel [Breznakibacter xylanolyticus]